MVNLTLKTKIIVALILVTSLLSQVIDSIRHPIFDTGDLDLLGVKIAKDINPDFFIKDYVFADDRYYRFYTPTYRWLVGRLWQATGSYELSLLWLVPWVVGLHLLAMFWLIYSITQDHWLAVGITLVSINYYSTIGGEFWGVDGISQLIPRTIFTAFAPLLFMALFAWLKKPGLRLSILFGLSIGLSANVHATSALHLASIVATLSLLTHGFSGRQWLNLPVLAAGIIIGAAPMMFNFLSNTGRPTASAVTFKAFSEAVKQHVFLPFSPPDFYWPMMKMAMERPLLDQLVWIEISLAVLFLMLYLWGHWRQPKLLPWLWLTGGLAAVGYGYFVAKFNLTLFFWIAALYIIYRFWQKEIDPLDGWLVAMLSLISLFSYAGYYILAWAWERFEIWSATSLLYEQVRAARFVYMPIYILVGRAGLSLALALKKWWRITDPGAQASLTAAIALVISFGDLLSSPEFFSSNSSFASLTFIGTIGLMLLLARFFSGPYRAILTTFSPLLISSTIIFICFGPLALLVKPYFPIPTANLWQPGALTVGSQYEAEDIELYRWVQTSTPRNALFYPCHIETSARLRFRYNTGRSITHAEKDLNLLVYNRASFVAFYERYKKLTEACQDPYLTISAGRELAADFVLTTAAIQNEPLDKFVCFKNAKYKVFTLNLSGCSEVFAN